MQRPSPVLSDNHDSEGECSNGARPAIEPIAGLTLAEGELLPAFSFNDDIRAGGQFAEFANRFGLFDGASFHASDQLRSFLATCSQTFDLANSFDSGWHKCFLWAVMLKGCVFNDCVEIARETDSLSAAYVA